MPTLAELNRAVGGELRGDGSVEITGVASLERAGPTDLAPLDSDRWLKAARTSRAGAFLVSSGVAAAFRRPVIRAEFAMAALNDVIEALGLVAPAPAPGVHASAVVDAAAEIGEGVHIGAFCAVGAARVGDRCILHPGAVVESGAEIGEGCILEAGAVIHGACRLGRRVRVGPHSVLGREGFGFAPGPNGPVMLHHIGRVVIEDDVHLGAATMVDRARFDETRIGRFSALDNLVHVGHNCRIGRRTFLAAQTGLAGNAQIGDDCEIGGQVGFANHTGVASGSRVGAQAGVTRFWEEPAELWGCPAAPIRDVLRQQAVVRRLARREEPR